MDIRHTELTLELSYGDLAASEAGKAALAALEAAAATAAQRITGLPAAGAEITGMSKVICRVRLSLDENDLFGTESEGADHE